MCWASFPPHRPDGSASVGLACSRRSYMLIDLPIRRGHQRWRCRSSSVLCPNRSPACWSAGSLLANSGRPRAFGSADLHRVRCIARGRAGGPEDPERARHGRNRSGAAHHCAAPGRVGLYEPVACRMAALATGPRTAQGTARGAPRLRAGDRRQGRADAYGCEPCPSPRLSGRHGGASRRSRPLSRARS